MHDSSFHELEGRKNIFRQIKQNVVSEGFKDNITSLIGNQYWWPFKKGRYESPVFRKEIRHTITLLSQKYKIYQICLKDDKICDKQICHSVPKQYGYDINIMSVYSKIKSKLTPYMNMLLYNSGIRDFWMKIDQESMEREKVRNLNEDKKVVKMSVGDPRFLAIVKMSGAGLAIGLVGFLFEMLWVNLVKRFEVRQKFKHCCDFCIVKLVLCFYKVRQNLKTLIKF